MKKILSGIILINIALYSQYQCFRLFPSDVNQIEPSIVIHQQNPQILFASAFTISGTILSEGIYISTNGGLNWTGTDAIHPSGDAGDPGPIVDKNGVFILTHQGGFVTGMYSNYSTNMGVNWSSTIQIASGDQEKGSPITDNVPSSPFYGRTYLAWTRFLNSFPIVISYTANSAASWSSLIQVNNTYNGNRSYGPSMAIGLNGEVFVCWASTLPISPFAEDKIGFASSTNGGLNWTVNESAYDCNGIKTTQLSPWTIRANSYPLMDIDKSSGPRNGWLYIVTAEKNLAPAGSDPDVIIHRSTNGGQTWSQGIRVNTDPLNNGRDQFFPAIDVDAGGGLNVVYYDNRNSADSVDVYLSRSLDGGSTWTDFRISDHRFYPRPVGAAGQGNMGDNIGITSGNGFLYPVWMSNKTGVLQTWTAIINYSTIGINKIGSGIPESYSLKQNYPNPFNPSTRIQFAIPKQSGNISITVYDINGREIKTLVNQQLKEGTYEAEFDGTFLGSGVYFYTLKADGFFESKKMILIK